MILLEDSMVVLLMTVVLFASISFGDDWFVESGSELTGDCGCVDGGVLLSEGLTLLL